MPSSENRVTPLILDELARGERRVLSLVVAIAKVLERTNPLKGDLTMTVRSALRTLVASGTIVDADGVYGLAPSVQTVSAPAMRQRRTRATNPSRTPVLPQGKSKEDRNKASTRRNAVKVEQYLTDVERAHGCVKAWAVRERLELGQVTLEELRGR